MRRGTHPALHLHQPLEQGMLVPGGHPNLRRLGSKHLPPAIPSIQDIQGIQSRHNSCSSHLNGSLQNGESF